MLRSFGSETPWGPHWSGMGPRRRTGWVYSGKCESYIDGLRHLLFRHRIGCLGPVPWVPAISVDSSNERHGRRPSALVRDTTFVKEGANTSFFVSRSRSRSTEGHRVSVKATRVVKVSGTHSP